MKFLQQILASALGCMLAMFLILIFVCVLLTGVAALVVTADGSSGSIEPHSVLLLTLDGDVPERTPDDVMSLVGRIGLSEQTLGLNDWLRAIDEAAGDDCIDGICLRIPAVTPASLETVSEIREALQRFSSTGKFVVSYSENYTQKGYYLASAAGSIYLHPAGSVQLSGLRAETLFYRDALDKLGVEVQVIRQGSFKSAVEPYLDNHMSAENRLQTSRYTGVLWQQMLEEICTSRVLNPDSLTAAMEDMRLSLPADALAAGLVDSLLYKDEFIARLVSLTGADDEDDLRMVTPESYLMPVSGPISVRTVSTRSSGDCVAVVYAEGDIVGDGPWNRYTITPEMMREAFRTAREDSTVKAVVFRINSGGGSALASDMIWREVALTAAEKPVVASLGAVAASGGYYVVAPSTRIMASPYTLTGSIGVFYLVPSVQKLLNDKLGIHSETVTTVPHADRTTALRPMTAEEREAALREVAFTYRTFLEHVAEGRSMPVDAVGKVAEGRVWAAPDAVACGLVDTLGTFEDAIELAARLGAVSDDYELWELPEPVDWMTELRASLQMRVQTGALKRGMLAPLWRTWRRIQHVTGLQGPCAMLPYEIELY